MKFSKARQAAWSFTKARRERLLAGHVRRSLVGTGTRWMFDDGSVLELSKGKYRVVK